ncbi:MAG: hypothetical protein H6812_01075 [Phycisphaeraceae bacterium]|nr:hypothetical protein [Phycisphaerales bacterium]MCB9841826.1 hypothetical protein [Phycisphaeraceae bacterium]
MGEAELLGTVAQFGMAGLIAAMWLIERKSALTRERELSEAHGRVMSQKVELDSLIEVVRENTRAVSALEGGQRELTALLHRAGGSAAAGSASDSVRAAGG